MFKRKLSVSDYLLILVNLIPLYCVWFEGWNASQVFLVYCLETVIIGLINVLKMACVVLFVKKMDVWENGGATSMVSGWFFIFFFIIHYGFFVFIQTQIFFSVSELIPGHAFLGGYSKIPALLDKYPDVRLKHQSAHGYGFVITRHKKFKESLHRVIRNKYQQHQFPIIAQQGRYF